MTVASRALRQVRSASVLAVALALVVAGALAQGCVSQRVRTATAMPNDPDFGKRLDELARSYESLDPEQILPYYVSTNYELSFEAPYELSSTSPEHRDTLKGVLDRLKDLHIALDPKFEAWRDGDRVWTIRGFNATGTTRKGEPFTMAGWYSAIWDKKGDKWLIWYEHFGGKPAAVVPPAPPAPPPPVVVPPPLAAAPIAFGDVFFDFDKWAIRPDQKATLAANIELLKQNAGVNVLIEGHCDERGGETYNFGLGDRRAAAVKKYLVGKGIKPERLAVMSYGKLKPFEQGHGEPVWSKNRRAHFVVIKP